MGKITEVSVDEKEKWNSIVRSFSNYDVFYLNEYVTAFMNEEEKNGLPILLYYENESERAINVVFKRDISNDEKLLGRIEKDTYFDLISPYGYGGFWGHIEDYRALNEEYNFYCLNNGYVCEFVRFELFEEYRKYYDGYTETRTHNVVRNLDISMDDIWMDFKQKVRKNVKRAISNNLEVIVDEQGCKIKDFLDIYYDTMERTNADKSFFFSKSFFEEINSMKGNFVYFHVLYKSKIIATELVIYGSESAYSFLGGTKSEYFNLRPNDFLKYEIIKWCYIKGLKRFVLGGGHGADDGIFKYKTCFAPHGISDFYIGHKIFDYKTYEKLVDIRKVQNPDCIKSVFFPKYRA
ncbi:MAG: GNAT family N-acetyltransferase [Lachnospiraceae bacterium]|nr:GNAT family N-acetyltransferase [Lachnospiraceae bacterium]